ncbi:hypothetical protein AVEN_243056-1 [Araneus ventricosus]|uniref:Tc1-like transposase DDE domain-containing protein n=1 Tax=Araneus ventricosus TaxID=182803 RepID=A0A4Y2KAE1_ARAVE|nr:hypothetical protein AVEN_243056-1 [Araneus ventricosus]
MVYYILLSIFYIELIFKIYVIRTKYCKIDVNRTKHCKIDVNRTKHCKIDVNIAIPQPSPKVTAWVAVCSRGIIGPFSIQETISSEPYITILEQFGSTQLALEDRPGIERFMQDGARPHRTEKPFRFLDEFFGNRVIAFDYPKFTVQEWISLHIRPI